ncbi:MAG: ATP-binding protein [Chloroflexales bacterium]|nr:ATP-binding protein [Chloroflexales bacterium]
MDLFLTLRSSIRRKVLLFTLGVALPPLLLIGWLGLSSLNRARDIALEEGADALRDQAVDTLERRVQDKAQLYDSALIAVQNQVEEVAYYTQISLVNSPALPARMDRVWIAPDGPTESNLAQHAETVTQARQLIPLLNAMVRGNPLVNIGYVSLEDGGVIAFNDEHVIDNLLQIAPFDPRLRPWYQGAVAHRSTIWTDAYVDANTRALTTTCAAPIYDSNDNIIGVVGFDLLLDTIQSDLMTLDMGKDGYAFLINNAGQIVVHPNLEAGDSHWNQPFQTENLRHSLNEDLRELAQNLYDRQPGVVQVFYEDHEEYIAYAPIQTAGWSLALVIPSDDVIQPALETGERIAQRESILWNQLLFLLIFAVLMLSAMATLASSSLTGPIRALQKEAQQIADGRLDHQLPAAGSDEIGQLIGSFNVMTSVLRQKIDELETNAQQLAKLNIVSNQLKAILDLSSLHNSIAAAVCQQFGFDRAALYIVDHNNRLLRAVAASFGRDGEGQAQQFIEAVNKRPLRLDESTIESDIVRSGQAVIVTGPWQHSQHLQPEGHGVTDQSYVAVPIFGREERVIGLLAADYQFSSQPVTAQDAGQLLMFANMVGLTIENVRLYEDLERTVAQRTEELRAALEQARLADRRKGDFLASISHELRTPLNAIIGFSSVLLEGIDGPLAPNQREDAQSIYRNGRFLLHLINELLDLAKIEAGHLNLEQATLDVHTLVGDAIDTTQALLRGSKLLLQTDLPSDLPQVYADSNRVRQILLNLLSNAVKFTEQGWIKISAHSLDEVDKKGIINSYIAISVQDTGIGIPIELQGKIFEEFRQFHGQRSRVHGTGLGLSITRRLIEAQSGRIWVKSIPGSGSTFTFTLPVYCRGANGATPNSKLPVSDQLLMNDN